MFKRSSNFSIQGWPSLFCDLDRIWLANFLSALVSLLSLNAYFLLILKKGKMISRSNADNDRKKIKKQRCNCVLKRHFSRLLCFPLSRKIARSNVFHCWKLSIRMDKRIYPKLTGHLTFFLSILDLYVLPF